MTGLDVDAQYWFTAIGKFFSSHTQAKKMNCVLPSNRSSSVLIILYFNLMSKKLQLKLF